MARFGKPARATLASLAVGATLAAPGPAAGAPAEGSGKVGLGVKRAACSRSPESGRSAEFVATMPMIPGASRMKMRFDFYSRPDYGGIWRRVKGVRSGWDAPKEPNTKLFVKTYYLTGPLVKGNSYRVIVRYRWLSRSGAVVRIAARVSKACVQPDSRPDVTLTARAAGTGRFLVALRNRGRAAVPFDLELATGARILDVRRVPGMKAGGAGVIFFSGIDCEPGSTVRVTADSRGELTERDELNNVVELRCPVAS